MHRGCMTAYSIVVQQPGQTFVNLKDGQNFAELFKRLLLRLKRCEMVHQEVCLINIEGGGELFVCFAV